MTCACWKNSIITVSTTRAISLKSTPPWVEQGMMDERIVTREMKLKDEFKETELYQKGVIWLNKQVQRDNRHLRSFDDLPKKLSVKEKHHDHTIHGGTGGVMTIMEDE